MARTAWEKKKYSVVLPLLRPFVKKLDVTFIKSCAHLSSVLQWRFYADFSA